MHCGYSDTNYIYCWHLSRSVLIVGIVSQNDKTTANLRIPCVIPSDRPLVKYLHFRQNKSQLSVTKVSFDPRTTQGSARRYSGLSPGLTSSPGLQSPGSWRLERELIMPGGGFITRDITNDVIWGVVTHNQELRSSVKVEVSGKGSVTILDIHQCEGPGLLIHSEHGYGVMATVSNIQESANIVRI